MKIRTKLDNTETVKELPNHILLILAERNELYKFHNIDQWMYKHKMEVNTTNHQFHLYVHSYENDKKKSDIGL